MSESWLYVRVERELNANAIVPVSQEQIEEAVSQRRAEIQRKKDMEAAVSEAQLDAAFNTVKAKFN